MPGKRRPADEKCEAPYRCDKGKAAPSSERQKIEAAAEQDAAGKKRPARHAQYEICTCAGQNCDAKQRDGMPHLVIRARADPIESFGRNAVFQPVGGEGTNGDCHESIDRTGGQPKVGRAIGGFPHDAERNTMSIT
jgi:hypothetical protein